MMAKEFEIAKIGVEEGVVLGLESNILCFPIWCYRGNPSIVQCVCKRRTSQSIFYMDNLPMKPSLVNRLSKLRYMSERFK